MKIHIMSIGLWLVVTTLGCWAQPSYNLRCVVLQNNGTVFDVKIQIQGSTAFGNGGANLVLDYNPQCLSNPVLLQAHQFSGGAYSPLSLSAPLPNAVSVNIEYGGQSGGATQVSATPQWTDVATIRFTTIGSMGTSNLTFRPVTAPQGPTIQYLDDMTTVLTPGTFIGDASIPLPVELLSFSARIDGEKVILNWTVASERSSAGYTVERCENPEGTFVERGFVPSLNHTLESVTYTFRDPMHEGPMPCWYRLRQMDFDGTVSYSSVLRVDTRMPDSFTIGSCFPNPHRQRTAIPILLPEPSDISIQVVDLAGRIVYESTHRSFDRGSHVLPLVLGELPPGSYTVLVSACGETKRTRTTIMK